MVTKAFLGLVGAVAWASAASQTIPRFANPKNPPNFIFIVSDDQDVRMGSLDTQLMVKKNMIQKGTAFSKHYSTASRVSLLTGRAAHNTNVTGEGAPYGGYPKFASEGWNDKYLPVWLQAAGYDTYFTGKLMDGLSVSKWKDPYANGWTASNNYVTDSSVDFLERAIKAKKPFFLYAAPIGPHAEISNDGTTPIYSFPMESPRHKILFPHASVPRTPNYNPNDASGGAWIKTQAQEKQSAVTDAWDKLYRQRILALQAVDDLVHMLVYTLERDHPDVLANTYIIYTSGNGYHIGQHRLPPGKNCPIEEDINVPFVIRGPGVAEGANVTVPTSHNDIVPTVFSLAGIPLQDDFDGVPMPVTAALQPAQGRRNEHVNIEFWGSYVPEMAGANVVKNNTYKSIRIISDDYDIAYTVWCTNEHEMYDMKNDPQQMKNIYTDTPGTVFGWIPARLAVRIDALLLVLKSCKGLSCREPWRTLHPQGNVHNLRDAMNTRYDNFYLVEQHRVTFTGCKPGYLPEFEGSLTPVPYEQK